jgi:hypothetical protein
MYNRHPGFHIQGTEFSPVLIAKAYYYVGHKSNGVPVLMDRIFVDASRARGGYDGPVMLASAMAGMREKNAD